MRNILFLCLFVLLATTACKKEDDRKQKLAEFLEQCEELSLFNGSVLVMQKGEKVFEGSYGYQNFETKEKNANDTKYRAFSITKSFTATVILQLEEEGKLTLADEISKYFPTYPKGDSITIENLLGHTSGIPNETASQNTVDEETFVKFMSDKDLEFSPNTSWNYSNSNYYLLGYIIKQVTGNDYDEEVEQRILKPLVMNNSGFGFDLLKDPNKAIGYRIMTKERAAKAMEFKTDHPFAAGALYSTTGDLYKFSEAIKNNTLLKKETLEKASVLQQGSEFGLGFQFDSIYHKVQIGHSGGGPGFLSHVRRIVEDDITLVFLSNNPSLSYALVQNMYRIILNMPYQLPNKSAMSIENLQKLAGTYTTDDNELYVNLDDGVLLFSEKFGGNCALYPITDTLFLMAEDITQTYKGDSLILNVRNQRIVRAKKNNIPLIWGIIGDATPNGWDGKDVPMVADEESSQIWRLKNYKLKKGGFQFRRNGVWSNNVSLSATGEVAANGYNIEVEDGVYDIELDMTDRFSPRYNLHKVN